MYLLISDTDKFLFPMPLQIFGKLHCIMAKISEIKTNIDTYIQACLSKRCYLLQTSDSRSMEKLTVHFRQYESRYVTVVIALLPVHET